MRTQLRILHQRNQRFQLLRSKSLEFLHDVSIIIQLKESRIKLHLLGKREGIDIAVCDIAIYRVTHTLGYVVMRNSGMSEGTRSEEGRRVEIGRQNVAQGERERGVGLRGKDF